MRFRDAENCYRQVLAHDPNHPRARLFVKDCQASKGMYYDEEAERGYTVLKQLHEIPVTDFELSVRSRNCLRKMNIRTLGDLTRTTEAALLSSKNFGETSLAEIKEMMQAKGLRLGMALEGQRPRPRPPDGAAPGSAARDAGDALQADRRPEPLGPGPQVHEQAQHPDHRRPAQAHRRRAAGVQELRRHLAQRGPRQADRAEHQAEERLDDREVDPSAAAPPIREGVRHGPPWSCTHHVDPRHAGRSRPVAIAVALHAARPATRARPRGPASLETPHGTVETPAFMPVGTQATVKGITPDQLVATGTRMILANTFHLALRPGENVVAGAGGLHRFMGWDGPILTDSGGFQVFSLAARTAIERRRRDVPLAHRRQPAGADARAGRGHPGGPRRRRGDVPRPLPVAAGRRGRPSPTPSAARSPGPGAARRRTPRADQALFGIVQGGPHADLRAECAEALLAMDFDGYAVGGVSVGEGRDEVRQALAVTTHLLPDDRPRYLMGVGRPQDILDAVATGIDLFDCVMPTRNGRNATCFTDCGPVKLRNAAHRNDFRPIEEGCDCLACRRFSRSYLRHLFLAKEMLGPILASIHNVTYLHRLTRRIREAISTGRFVQLRLEVLEALGP